MAVAGSLGTYMYADVLGKLSLMSTAAILGMLVTILFISCAPKFTKKFGSERVLRTSLLLGAGLYVGLFAAHALTTVNIWVHIGWNAIASGMANLSNMMQWGMLGESIEYNEYLTGKRTEGSINGTFNMLRRAGQGLGAATGVALLGMIGYDATATVQSAATILGIKALCLLFPAACALGSRLVFRFLWNLTPELRQKIAAAKTANS
jgi:GPH family glycoside/pentoside/hexuronide:cation symporter